MQSPFGWGQRRKYYPSPLYGIDPVEYLKSVPVSSATWDGDTSAWNYLADDITALGALFEPCAVFGLNQYVSTETRALRVSNSASSEIDIGFSSKKLDEAAIATHCGASAGTCKTLYNQMGNGFDATQSTKGNQLLIYDGTGVYEFQGQPGLYNSNASDLFLTMTTSANKTFTADATTDVLTLTAHKLPPLSYANLSTTGTLPAGLVGAIAFTASGTTVDTTNDQLVLSAHGLVTGLMATFSGTLPSGLSATGAYYVAVVDPDNITLHKTLADADAGTNKIDLTTTGSGTVTLTPYYWFRRQDADTVKVYRGQEDATNEVGNIDVTSAGSGTHTAACKIYALANSGMTMVVFGGFGASAGSASTEQVFCNIESTGSYNDYRIKFFTATPQYVNWEHAGSLSDDYSKTGITLVGNKVIGAHRYDPIGKVVDGATVGAKTSYGTLSNGAVATQSQVLSNSMQARTSTAILGKQAGSTGRLYDGYLMGVFIWNRFFDNEDFALVKALLETYLV